MKTQIQYLCTVAIATVLLLSCNSSNSSNSGNSNSALPKSAEQSMPPAGKSLMGNPLKGSQVPNNLVCMVNDAYMGKEQLAVPFDGKTYYGCCQMCKERIPQDESVRYAVEPRTLNKVDKATAYIVLIGDQDEVAYFENQASYEQFYAESKTVQ